MTTIILCIIIIALLVYIGFSEYNNRKERKSFLNAILAKDVPDMVNLELADKTEIKAEKKTESHDLVSESDLDSETFDRQIKEVIGDGY